MKNKIKKIGILTIFFITGLVEKVNAANIPGDVAPIPVSSKINRIIIGVENYLYLIFSLTVIIWVIVILKNTYLFLNKKKEIKLKQQLKLNGQPEFMDYTEDNDVVELDKLKKKLIKSIKIFIIILIVWFFSFAKYIDNQTARTSL